MVGSAFVFNSAKETVQAAKVQVKIGDITDITIADYIDELKEAEGPYAELDALSADINDEQSL